MGVFPHCVLHFETCLSLPRTTVCAIPALVGCKCISLNIEQHLIRSIREPPNTTAGITQCHAATHTWPLSSPGLSRNRDKQHEICADSALHGPGLLQDRTHGWLVSLHMSKFLIRQKNILRGWHSTIVLQTTTRAQTLQSLEKRRGSIGWV